MRTAFVEGAGVTKSILRHPGREKSRRVLHAKWTSDHAAGAFGFARQSRTSGGGARGGPAGRKLVGRKRVPLRVTGALDGVKAVGGNAGRTHDGCFVGRYREPSPTASSIRRALWCVQRRAKPALVSALVTAKGRQHSRSSARTLRRPTAEFMKAVPQAHQTSS